MIELVLPVIGAEEIESLQHLVGDLFVRGEQQVIGIHPGSLLVEVAGAHGSIPLRHLALDPGYQAQLGMNLQPRYPVDDLHPLVEQPVSPVDVGLLVEPCLQFNHGCHTLAVAGSIHQCVNDA